MNEVDALDLLRESIWTVITTAGPPVALAMAVGIIIGLLQAVTQVQEVTLTFVPKIAAIFISLIVLAPFIGSEIYSFTEIIFQRIQHGF